MSHFTNRTKNTGVGFESMGIRKKQIREIVGYTFPQIESNAQGWFDRACSFSETAKLLAEKSESTFAIPYYFNASLSIELILKSIIIAKGKNFNKDHKLNELCKNAEVKITRHQECILELLSEIITWAGRYPVPKAEGQWDHYHDSILEKHIVRERDGKTFRTLAYKDRFPNLENYLKIWNLCEETFKSC